MSAIPISESVRSILARTAGYDEAHEYASGRIRELRPTPEEIVAFCEALNWPQPRIDVDSDPDVILDEVLCSNTAGPEAEIEKLCSFHDFLEASRAERIAGSAN